MDLTTFPRAERDQTDATVLLGEARALERAARVPEAMLAFSEAARLAATGGDTNTLATALRSLAVLHQQRGDPTAARTFCTRAYTVAKAAGLDGLAAESLNTLGVIRMLSGEPGEARGDFVRALALGQRRPDLRARVEQNLGILANIQGSYAAAIEHYERSLALYQQLQDEHGCAIAYHNLGMVSADRHDQPGADRHFRQSLAIATRTGDRSLHALCLVSLAETAVALQRFEDARRSAEEALHLYGALGNQRGRADAYRVIGMVYRETGRAALAESRLTSAIELAVGAEATLIEAESCRELALLHQASRRNVEALQLLTRAHRLFKRLDARRDAVHVGSRMSQLQATYLDVVRGWGESIESSDCWTFGHCERVARNAVAMARALRLDEQAETTILIGAYLHDLGMVRVPHEILAAGAELADAERAVLQRHPVWGVELLAGIEFPWEIKPIVRWHHERRDGSGYPDRLRGSEVPIGAEIVGILDAYDELCTGRFGRAPLTKQDAAAELLARGERWWSPAIIEAFRAVIA